MSARAVDMQSARFWAHAATFGALWGAIEATVGAFVHAVKVPFGGTALAATGAALLLALRVVYPRPGVIVAAGAVCACATFWALTQKVLTQVILYGAPVITLYKELLARGEAWLNLPKNAGIAAVVVFAAVVGCLGAVIALVGLRAGQVAMERRARTEEALA
jgi:hypothetical protein